MCAAAKSDKNVKIVEVLIRADTEMDVLHNDMSPLMTAAKCGSTKVIKTLIAYKASLQFQSGE